MKHSHVQIIAVVFGGILLLLAGTFAIVKCCGGGGVHPHPGEGKMEGYSGGSLALGTNDGLQPGKFWGIYGAPWQTHNTMTLAGLNDGRAQGESGWSWGMYQIPYKDSWWNSSYSWYFDPMYWQADVAINTYNLCEKMCMDNYKTSADAGEFKRCMASCPKIDISSIGH